MCLTLFHTAIPVCLETSFISTKKEVVEGFACPTDMPVKVLTIRFASHQEAYFPQAIGELAQGDLWRPIRRGFVNKFIKQKPFAVAQYCQTRHVVPILS